MSIIRASVPLEQRSDFVWLPTWTFAHTWRAYQSTGAEYTISGQTTSGNGDMLPSPSAQTHQQWVLHSDDVINLQLSPVDTDAVGAELPTDVKWYQGDQLLQTKLDEHGSALWQPPGTGVYVIHGEWSDTQQSRTTNPVLVVVRHPVETFSAVIEYANSLSRNAL